MSEPTRRALADCFADLPDPRIDRQRRHEFMDILMIVLCGTLVGADDFVSAEAFARAKEPWMRERLGLKLPNGIPSHDTLNRVFAAIDPQAFGDCFTSWMMEHCDGLQLKQVAVDGKALRATKSRKPSKAGPRTSPTRSPPSRNCCGFSTLPALW